MLVNSPQSEDQGRKHSPVNRSLRSFEVGKPPADYNPAEPFDRNFGGQIKPASLSTDFANRSFSQL
jgi:hypothetical protein